MSLCDRESFLEDMRTMETRERLRENEQEQARQEYEDLIDGKINEIKYVKYDDIYEELYEKYSKEYDLKREEGKWWGITIRREYEK